jgi:cytochrome c-type biogenesis protein
MGVMGGGVGNLVQSGPLLLAVPVAAAAGAITFLSPCCLPLVPGYLSYVTGMSGTDAERPAVPGADDSGPGSPRGRTVLGTALFVLGFSVVFTIEGGAFGGLGVALRGQTGVLTAILGGLTIVLGLLFAGVFDRFPVTGRIMRPSIRPRVGLAGAPGPSSSRAGTPGSSRRSVAGCWSSSGCWRSPGCGRTPSFGCRPTGG